MFRRDTFRISLVSTSHTTEIFQKLASSYKNEKEKQYIELSDIYNNLHGSYLHCKQL